MNVLEVRRNSKLRKGRGEVRREKEIARKRKMRKISRGSDRKKRTIEGSKLQPSNARVASKTLTPSFSLDVSYIHRVERIKF
jgi:hypothetical protein